MSLLHSPSSCFELLRLGQPTLIAVENCKSIKGDSYIGMILPQGLLADGERKSEKRLRLFKTLLSLVKDRQVVERLGDEGMFPA